MTSLMRRTLDRLWGSGDAAVTVPPMDGALRPNHRLDEAAVLKEVPGPDNLIHAGADVLFSSGSGLFQLNPDTGEATLVEQFGAPVTALAGLPSGSIAAGLADGQIVFRGPNADRLRLAANRPTAHGPTALAFDGDGVLYACWGSRTRSPDAWKHDLMSRAASGSVWRFDLANGSARSLAEGLAWPNGLLAGDGRVMVSESWRHRILSLTEGSAPKVVLDDLPGYLARLAPAKDGGTWLCIFAPRTQLIEFVLREPGYRTRMIREVDPEYWVAPSLHPARSFLEPLQGGAVKHLGILKPWAPSRSCGLIVHLDASFQPDSSLHSRADGIRHGVTSCLETGSRLIAASRGSDAILSVDPALHRSGS